MDKDADARKDGAWLFRRAVGDVRRHDDDTVILRGKRPGPDPRYTRLDHEAVLKEMLSGETPAGEAGYGDEVFFQRPGVQRSVMRKLRRAQFAVQDELDLHGMTVAEAKTALGAFIQQCVKRSVYCVRIVHGKGHRSPGREPVLKPKVVRWLSQLGNVVAFSSARPVDGGTGALYVLLKRSGR
jgi:DNA-nicking Smr family endonuclease